MLNSVLNGIALVNLGIGIKPFLYLPIPAMPLNMPLKILEGSILVSITLVGDQVGQEVLF